MNVVAWHPEDLIDKRLAGELTDDEASELDAHLELCVACRFEALVADDLRLDDEELEAESQLKILVQNAVHPEPAEAPTSRRRRVGPGLVLVAAILVAGSAAALYRLAQPPAPPAAAPSAPATPPSVDAVRVDTDPSSPPIAPPVDSAEPDNGAPSPALAASTAPATAASLFASANAARRAGKRDLALGLYRQLQARFPQSQEAKLSKATVGRMMLDDDPKRALESYNDYLEGGDGAVSEEALVGRATALERMGKPDEERAAWRDLLSRYPKSLHADRAKARLAELSVKK